MLLQNNATESMNEMTLLVSVIFWAGLIITYILIIYYMEHPKKKKLKLTYGETLKKYSQDHLIHYDSNSENDILLVNDEFNKK